jgi:tetratricopeptide (TPR) repeat protein
LLIASYGGADPSPRMTYYYHKGLTLHAMGNYDEAIAAFSAGIPEQPDYYWVYYYRALSYEKTGQRDKTVEDLKTLAAHTEQKNWSDEIKAKLAQYKISGPQDKSQTPNESTPKSWTMAAEVLAHLEATKDYRELSALYNRKVAADLNWLQSAEGRAVDAQLKNWRSDAAATVIVDDKEGRILRYSVGGVIVRDPGIAAADLERSPAYRQTIAEAIAQNIMTSRDGQRK